LIGRNPVNLIVGWCEQFLCYVGQISCGTEQVYDTGLGMYANCEAVAAAVVAVVVAAARAEIEGGGKKLIGGVAAVAGRLALFLYREWSGSFGSSKVGRGLATKLHPHLIVLALYVAMEEEQQKRK